MKVKIRVKTEVKPTEDEEKVKKALKNIISAENIELIEEDNRRILIVEGEKMELLSKLREILIRRRILSAARAILKKSITAENSVTFYLNKQAAYMGQVSFCEEKGESPLGPITVEIICDNSRDLEKIINWLTSED